ncbi:MAG TPA: hypothetical protein VFA76_14870 [Terriglobales bacterium]|jgi:hypothetical protein|nr:hypothetical protein [Terriglobales bacterium]
MPRIIRECVQVVEPLPGNHTKVLVESDKESAVSETHWNIPTDAIPVHLRPTGSRFVVVLEEPSGLPASTVAQLQGSWKLTIVELPTTEGRGKREDA